MYSVLLVDDEKLIREGVSELLTMANLDLDITTAASAIDAIAVLENRKIDIAVMDISMPQMSGMELYDIVREQWPHCKLIFLTGFLEFDYVYKVHRHARYILKAEDDQKLVDAVRESINEIENDMLLERIGQGGFVPQLSSRYFERNILFKELLANTRGGRHQMMATLAAANLDLELERDVYCVVLQCRALQTMDYAGWNTARESLLALIHRYCMDSFRGECFGYNHSVLYLLIQPRKEMGRPKTVSQLEGITELLQKAVNKNLSVPLSALIREHPVSVDLAIRDFSALSDSMLGMESDEIRVTDLAADSAGENTALSPEIRRELSRKITQMESQFDSMDRDGIVLLLEELRTRLRGVKNMNDLFAMEMYYCVSAKLLSYIQRVGIGEETARQIGVSNLYTVTQYASWSDAFANLKRVVEHVFHQVDRSIESKNEDVINKVKHYIRHHLDGDTSLYALSSYVHLCPEHLLRIFKKQEGVTILQYINDVKLAKAKQMLTETDMQAKEIAVELGFTSAGYFGRFFKSKMDVTPNAYREQNRKTYQEAEL